MKEKELKKLNKHLKKVLKIIARLDKVAINEQISFFLEQKTNGASLFTIEGIGYFRDETKN